MGMILLAILFTCFSVYLELEVPTYISKITDLLELVGTNLDELWQPASMMLGNVLCLLVRSCSWIFCVQSGRFLY